MLPTPAQTALVLATLPRLAARPQQAAMAFRLHLMRVAPALAVQVTDQFASPVALLAGAIARIDSADDLRDHVQPLAHQLRAMGLSPRGYVALHAALMDMVIDHIPNDAADVEDAWADMIGAILSTMLVEAYGPHQHSMPLAA